MQMANTAVAAGVMLAESDSLVRPLPGLLDGLGKADCNRLRAIGREKVLEPGQLVWSQGDEQTGIYLIGSGRIRSYYAAPSGREVTLAYWFAGNFVGGPDPTIPKPFMCIKVPEVPTFATDHIDRDEQAQLAAEFIDWLLTGNRDGALLRRKALSVESERDYRKAKRDLRQARARRQKHHDRSPD